MHILVPANHTVTAGSPKRRSHTASSGTLANQSACTRFSTPVWRAATISPDRVRAHTASPTSLPLGGQILPICLASTSISFLMCLSGGRELRRDLLYGGA